MSQISWAIIPWGIGLGATWVVYADDKRVAQGHVLTRRQARKSIREFVELWNLVAE